MYSYNRIAKSLHNCLTKLQVNSSSNLDQNAKLTKTFIPYPRSGHYFVSLISFCHKNTKFPSHGLTSQLIVIQILHKITRNAIVNIHRFAKY